MTHWLLSPLDVGIVLLIVRWTLRGTGRVAWRRATEVLIGACVALMTPLGANALVWLLEHQVVDAPACAARPQATIVALAGGFDRKPVDANDFAALTPASLRRMLAASATLARLPESALVVVGGGPYAISEARVAANFLIGIGVPARGIRIEDRSTSTWQNAERVAALAPALPRDIVLTSSAMHLPRALFAFRHAGFSACALPSDREYLPPGGLGYFIPQSSALGKSEEAIHEIVGTLYYAARALVPSGDAAGVERNDAS